MDKFGIINLSELDKWIADYIRMRDGWRKNTPNWEVYDLMVRELSKLKDQCSKLPSAEDCWVTARYEDEKFYPTFEDYITNYKP